MLTDESTEVPPLSPAILACLKAPGSGDDVGLDADALRGARDGTRYPFVQGVPSLFRAVDEGTGTVTTRVRSFYEENPFPNYEGMELFSELVNKGKKNPFSANLLRSIGYNKRVVECGCGTGQLSHFLQLNHNQVLGVDMSIGSLKLAMEHKRRNRLLRSNFVQMNLFDLAIKSGSFDVAITQGVLHHTFDPKRAFTEVVRTVKPGGIVVVGLYNRWGRIPTWIRSKLIGVLGPQIDFVVRRRIRDRTKSETWIKDQYFNPHESWHSVDEVMKWFADTGIEYLNCSPAILGTAGEDTSDLFAKTDPGTAYQRLMTQLGWIGTIAREGALFDVIGRKIA
ncbi:MAG: class I SAM-dependent methyltransferase [Rhodospirillales bacterium]|nr:class I SAM-dependent methyltransferase [Rhodospirillales bacterium]